jgi:hypothetical protein
VVFGLWVVEQAFHLSARANDEALFNGELIENVWVPGADRQGRQPCPGLSHRFDRFFHVRWVQPIERSENRLAAETSGLDDDFSFWFFSGFHAVSFWCAVVLPVPHCRRAKSYFLAAAFLAGAAQGFLPLAAGLAGVFAWGLVAMVFPFKETGFSTARPHTQPSGEVLVRFFFRVKRRKTPQDLTTFANGRTP